MTQRINEVITTVVLIRAVSPTVVCASSLRFKFLTPTLGYLGQYFKCKTHVCSVLIQIKTKLLVGVYLYSISAYPTVFLLREKYVVCATVLFYKIRKMHFKGQHF